MEGYLSEFKRKEFSLFSVPLSNLSTFPHFSLLLTCVILVSRFLSLVLQLRSCSELGQDILNDCLTIQSLQTAPSPHNAMDNALGQSTGPAHDIYPGMEKTRKSYITTCLGLGIILWSTLKFLSIVWEEQNLQSNMKQCKTDFHICHFDGKGENSSFVPKKIYHNIFPL